MMALFLAVGLGGFLGACARFGLTRLLTPLSDLPFGTLLSNVLAGLMIGLIVGFERRNTALPQALKLFLTTGFLGGLSTFSSFSLETILLFEEGQYFKACANSLLNLVLSFAAVVLGLWLARAFKPQL